jgi:hypothetical protein
MNWNPREPWGWVEIFPWMTPPPEREMVTMPTTVLPTSLRVRDRRAYPRTEWREGWVLWPQWPLHL